ncbi:MAG TPA: hypothetical protein VG733_03990 [Chthoniobacteraceae bacterium]|nr:hypothetical protein [Chthoniobacteraceae bacterium]
MKKFLLPALLFALAVLATTPAMAQRGGGGGGGFGGGGGGNNNNANNANNANANNQQQPGTKVPLWICNSPGGTYEVALRSIVSVSTCEYIVDGVAKVTEVNIDTQGNMAVRFYYLEPLTPNAPDGLGQSGIDKAKEIAEELASRTGQDDVWSKVIKNYPTSTHAHTIEYRVDSKDDLMKIFQSAEAAFRTFTPDTLSVGAASANSPNPDNPGN